MRKYERRSDKPMSQRDRNKKTPRTKKGKNIDFIRMPLYGTLRAVVWELLYWETAPGYLINTNVHTFACDVTCRSATQDCGHSHAI